MFNYHTHTVFCGHAKHTVSEMVAEAVNKGFSRIGISEHFDRDINNELCGSLPYDPKDYFDEINEAKETYKGRIEVLAGAEMDFYLCNFLDVYKELVSYGADYILGSVHRVPGFSFSKGDIPFNYKTEKETEYIIKEYLGTVFAMVKSGCVNCLDHFDIYKRSYVLKDESIFYDYYDLIADACRENDVAVEYNTHYNRGEFKYKDDINLYMWNKIRDYDIPVVVSSDCHSKEELDYRFASAFEFLKYIGIKTTCSFKNRQVVREKLNY